MIHKSSLNLQLQYEDIVFTKILMILLCNVFQRINLVIQSLPSKMKEMIEHKVKNLFRKNTGTQKYRFMSWVTTPTHEFPTEKMQDSLF